MKNDRILIVAAHPDDEVLGCAGTVTRFINKGFRAYTLLLGEGTTAREGRVRDTQKIKDSISSLKKSACKANKILGIKELFMHNFPDNRFDTVPFLDIVKKIEDIKRDLKPGIIFTHYENDLNIDHQITCRAVITAARPLPGETVKEIYSFEVLSSTDWLFPNKFEPSVFFDITETLHYKLKAIEAYNTELRDFPHPRSLEGINLSARYWGMHAGLKYAEAFKNIRIIK